MRSSSEEATYFAQWCHVTAYHGVLDFHLARNILSKIFWFLIVISGLFLTLNQIAEFVLGFVLEDQFLTSVSSEMSSNGVLPWPNMTMCNLGEFSSRKIAKYGLVGETSRYLVDVGIERRVEEFFGEMEGEVVGEMNASGMGMEAGMTFKEVCR